MASVKCVESPLTPLYDFLATIDKKNFHKSLSFSLIPVN